jgi:hypothetical protein
MFEISFSDSSDTNHGSLLYNTTYTGPPRLRYVFQVVQTQTTAAEKDHVLILLFSVGKQK